MKNTFKFIIYFGAVILFLIILFDQLIMPMYTRHGDSFVLPDITLMDKKEAFEKLDDIDVTPVWKDSIYDENIETGKVIQQTPLPFSKVKKGRKIYLITSRGPQIKLMPDFRGFTIREVRLQLQDLALQEGRIQYKENSEFPEGVVFGQNPDPGNSFSPGATISFQISLGTGTQNKRLPQLVGLSLMEAKKKLSALKILNIKIESEKNESLLPGTVIKQTPAKGTPVLEINEVLITISK